MSSSVKNASHIEPDIEANERAITHLIGEYERVRDERDDANKRLEGFVDTIDLLMSALPIEKRIQLQRGFNDVRKGKLSPNRGSETYSNVIALFEEDNRKEWTVSDVQEALEHQGKKPDTKAIYNALGYLAKTGMLRRISRGRYSVSGSSQQVGEVHLA